MKMLLVLVISKCDSFSQWKLKKAVLVDEKKKVLVLFSLF